MLRAGFAKLDITPGPEVDLIGYDFRQELLPPGNLGVRDPLFVRALVLDQDGQKAALISLDLCIISIALARRWRQEVAKALGITPERVLISCTHTHSGPWLQEPELADGLGAALPHTTAVDRDSPGQRYATAIGPRVSAAAIQASGLTVPVSVAIHEAPLGLGYCRRVLDDAGKVRHCWNPQEYPELAPGPSADPTLSVLVLRQLNGPRSWILHAHGAHPVVLGKTSRVVSADWPGAANACLQQWFPDSEPMFLLGACGDVHPWISTQERGEGVEVVGRAEAAAVALLVQAGGSPDPDPGLEIVSRTVRFGAIDCDLAVWRIGTCILAASPTELFAGLSADLRRRLPGPALIASNCNGWTGYWPTVEAAAQGGYEVDGSRIWGREAEDGQRLVEVLAAMAEGIG